MPYPDETDEITDFPPVSEDQMDALDGAAIYAHGTFSSRSSQPTIDGNLYESTDVTSLAYYSAAATAWTPLLQLVPASTTVNVTAKNGQMMLVAASGVHVTLPAATQGSLVAVWNSSGTGSSPTTVTAGGADILGEGVPSGVTTWVMGSQGQSCIFTVDAAGVWVCISGEYDTGWVTVASLGSGITGVWGTTLQTRRRGDTVRIRGGLTGTTAQSVGTTLFTSPVAPGTNNAVFSVNVNCLAGGASALQLEVVNGTGAVNLLNFGITFSSQWVIGLDGLSYPAVG